MIFLVQWTSVTGGSLLICATIVALAVGLYRIGPVGAQTVSTLESLVDSLEKKVQHLDEALTAQSEAMSDKDDDLHQREKEVVRLQGEVQRLLERPSTEQLYEMLMRQHEARSTMHEENTRMLGEIASAVKVLVDRDQAGRRGDGEGT